MNEISKNTMVSIGTVIAVFIPAAIGWGNMEEKMKNKADKIEVERIQHKIDRRLYRIEEALKIKDREPVTNQGEE